MTRTVKRAFSFSNALIVITIIGLAVAAAMPYLVNPQKEDDRYSLSRNTVAQNLSISAFARAKNNTAIGKDSLFSNEYGESNVAIGHYALYSSKTGDNNIAIGFEAGKDADALSNKIYITANALHTGKDSIIYGDDTEGARKLYFNVTDKQVYLSGKNAGDKVITRAEMEKYAVSLSSVQGVMAKNLSLEEKIADLENQNKVYEDKIKILENKNKANDEVIKSLEKRLSALENQKTETKKKIRFFGI